jgi:uncharacterized protein (TIGR02145 family)
MKTTTKPLFQKYLFFVCFSSILFFFSTCKKEETIEIIPPQFDSIADIENNYYTTVKIGNQWWMAEDLKVKLFNDSTPIFDGQSNENWIKNRPSFCLYQNNTQAPGLLYNGFAVLDSKKIAPKGWHIPSDAEWKELEKHLGLSEELANSFGWRGTTQGIKLKVFGREDWLIVENSTWPTNESGFSARAGSNRLYNATWGEPGLAHTGFWWTSTEYNSDKLIFRHLDYKENGVFKNYENKFYGFSIRCIKDN